MPSELGRLRGTPSTRSRENCHRLSQLLRRDRPISCDCAASGPETRVGLVARRTRFSKQRPAVDGLFGRAGHLAHTLSRAIVLPSCPAKGIRRCDSQGRRLGIRLGEATSGAVIGAGRPGDRGRLSARGDIVSASGIKLLRVALWNNAIRILKQRWSGLHLGAHSCRLRTEFSRRALSRKRAHLRYAWIPLRGR